MKDTGVVYLVGAGPGDPGLMTEKGLSRLRTCDAVVYDSLISERLLDEVPEGCQKIYVGKRAGHHSMKQEEINNILTELAGKGLKVVRLKGGDPFVFGRGGEEVMALLKEGIPYEIISGVTSAVAALASAGIPITHRAVSRSFHVMTGHTLSDDGSLPLDFQSFGKLSGTLVFLMGLGNLPSIVSGLISQGKSASTPAAVIESGTLPGQRVVRGTLDDIEKKVCSQKIHSPAIIVVGEVASLDFTSTLHEPLKGCRIGITGTASFGGKLCSRIEERGGTVRNLLTLSVKSYRSGEEMKVSYKKLSKYSWLVFTSAAGVREFFQGLLENGHDYRAVGHMKFAVVGNGTAKELLQYGFKADFIPERYHVNGLAEGLISQLTEKDRLLIPRSRGGSAQLNEILDKAGISYDDRILYEIDGKGKDMRKEGWLEELDYLTFASASGVETFFTWLSESERECLLRVKFACIGDITAKALEKYGTKADVIGETYNIEGLVYAIEKDWNEKGSQSK